MQLHKARREDLRKKGYQFESGQLLSLRLEMNMDEMDKKGRNLKKAILDPRHTGIKESS